jgi:beta-lactamase class A
MGEQVPLGWLASEMITVSSNLATDLVLELVGVDAANAVLAGYGSGLSAIRRGIDDVAAQAAGISNEMSPADLAAVLVAVGNDKGASGDYLRDLLAANTWNGEIPAGLPAGTRVEHKNGWDTRIRHDGGIVRPADAEAFVLAVCATSELPEADAQKLIAAVAAEAWKHRHDLEAVR